MAELSLSTDRLAASGILDVHVEPELRIHCRKLLESGAKDVTIDLSRVETISSICIGTLVATWIDLRSEGRRMTLVASPGVKRILDMTGLSTLLAGE